MKKQNYINKLVLSAMFLALAYVLPFFTGQVPEIGNMLCPMHIPVILCGYICGGPWGLAVGFVAPLLRSLTIGMPVLFPKAVSMACELAVYGILSGVLYRLFPKKKIYIYVSLIVSMIVGRAVWGVVQFACLGFDISKFGFAVFWTEAVMNAIPGIILQIIAIPLVIMIFEKFKLIKR
ncbi:MAG: ECF transporter S component [Acutalibacteraceae bacterium]|nr:ECF transporter S component [Acutalibacteraceae bacterium]